ncbi:MAG: hypothetical protein KBT10_03910 [Bacteroidales bacterium]|nr:hypothetical protein [Candidatus Sodaliphilus aphodohippi]
MTDNKTNQSTTPSVQKEWKGMTLEELRMRRAMSLVRREMGRARIMQNFENTRTQVQSNGIRGLLFSSKTVARLKTADYLLLGAKIAGFVFKRFIRKRR